MKKIFMAISLCFFSLSLRADDGFGFDDLEMIEQSEQAQLLQMAKDEAKAYHFSKAEDLIQQAQNKAYSPDEFLLTQKPKNAVKMKKKQDRQD